MMKLSTKGRYGLKAMFELALRYSDEPVSLNIIAESQHISLNYLEQLIAPLRRAGFVTSVRGAQGGYRLARNPEEITVKDILETLEGPLAPTHCVVDAEDEGCSNMEYCVTRLIWEKIRNSIDDIVRSTTLADMVSDHDKMMDKLKQERSIRI